MKTRGNGVSHISGKVVVVVGASSGMGRATSLALAREGARVAACARRVEPLNELQREVESGGGTLVALPLDVRDRNAVFETVREAVRRFGRIDALIYSAGVNIPRRGLDVLSSEDWDELIAINLTGAFHCTQAALEAMKGQEDGQIIYISSVSAKRGDMSGVAYQAAKRGIDGLMRGAMTELEGGNVRFSVIYPGLCDTPLVEKRPTPPTPEVRALALKPEDIAEACVYVVGTPAHVHVQEIIITPKAPLR